jgi:hypothetical protein
MLSGSDNCIGRLCRLISLVNIVLLYLLCLQIAGLYLYMLVVETFTGENIKLRVYVLIGWGK